MLSTVALTWPPSNTHGWGVFGANFLREMLRLGRPQPLLLVPADPAFLNPADKKVLAPLLQQQAQLQQQFAAHAGSITVNGACVVHGLGNGLGANPINRRFIGEPNVGFTFFERVDFPDDIIERSRWMDAVMAGSTWNADVLKGLGFPKVGCVFQGVDTEKFKPAPLSGDEANRFGDRFVVFSGGKFEIRKAQDLVLAAFKRFHDTHPDSLLVTVWHNPWPQTMEGMLLSPHVEGIPAADVPAPEAIGAWAQAQGLPAGAHVDLGFVANAEMPELFRHCHVGLFPNRCEGGTNLVAMEAMASGLPCVLSANSGHMDIVGDERAYPLTTQRPIAFEQPGGDHWRESDIDEIVAALETAYADREDARRRGQAAHEFMQGLSWQKQIPKLLQALEGFAA